jgi:hypothetical protein
VQRFTALLVVWLCLGSHIARAQLVPFILPWDDSVPSATDFSALNTPIGSGSWVGVDTNGHFVVQGSRIRFLGVNFAQDPTFQGTNVMDAMAARLAKFGINNVRFHHMDPPWARDGGLIAYTPTTSTNLNARNLERLHYMVAALKRRGVYANINLLVGREFRSGDGLGPEVAQFTDWKDPHILGFFNDRALDLQKDFARKLLLPTNRFTGLPLARDPAVSFVEILNENGLLQKWYDGTLDRLPASYSNQLRTRWNAWLTARHTNDAALLNAWRIIDQPLALSRLRNGNFTNGLIAWNLERHSGAQATGTSTNVGGRPALRVNVTTPGTAEWHVQLNQAGLSVIAGQPYTLTFSVFGNARFNASVMHAVDPFQSVGFSRDLNITDNAGTWRTFTFTFAASQTHPSVRVNFGGLGNAVGSLTLGDVRFQNGGRLGVLPPGSSLAAANVPAIARSGDSFTGTRDARLDWLRFCVELEHLYWGEMRRFLRDDIGYPGLVFGTMIANSPPNVQGQLDVVDTHAYWQHPEFPATPWDPANWFVQNRSLVNELADGNTIGLLARQRVRGKPHTVTEYQHPTPNDFAAEGPVLLAAYGALQDWDGLWMFDYGPGSNLPIGGDTSPMGRIRGFFDHGQHPAKMASLLLAANLFRRGDVAPARNELVMRLTPELELTNLLQNGSAWNVFSSGHLGVSSKSAQVNRLSVSIGSQATGALTAPPAPAGNILTADTGELRWDASRPGRGMVTIRTPQTRALTGFPDGGAYGLDGVVIQPGATRLGWCTLGLTLRSGDLTNGGNALIIATGLSENTGWRWRDTNRNTLGTQWGRAPVLTEVVPFRLTLPVPAARVRIWALDERGQRRSELAVTGDATQTRLDATTNTATLWYEVEIRRPTAGFQSWREQTFTPAELADPAISGPTALRDGLPNLLRYAFNLAPGPVARLPINGGVMETNAIRHLVLRAPRRRDATDLEYQPELSADLATWSPGTDQLELVSSEPDGPIDWLTYRDREPLGTAEARYLRLRVALRP